MRPYARANGSDPAARRDRPCIIVSKALAEIAGSRALEKERWSWGAGASAQVLRREGLIMWSLRGCVLRPPANGWLHARECVLWARLANGRRGGGSPIDAVLDRRRGNVLVDSSRSQSDIINEVLS